MPDPIVSIRSNRPLAVTVVVAVLMATVVVLGPAAEGGTAASEVVAVGHAADEGDSTMRTPDQATTEAAARRATVDDGAEKRRARWFRRWLRKFRSHRHEQGPQPNAVPTTVPTTTVQPPPTSPPSTAAPTTISHPPTTGDPTTTSIATSTSTTSGSSSTHGDHGTTTAPANDSAGGSSTLWRLTVGSHDKTEMDTSAPANAGSAHGTRIYCVVSHFSHDDSIVFPGRPGAAHAHMFWGNTGTDAFSDGASLASSGASSCEGGTNNRSAYWIPTLFDDNGQAVVPESIFVYYKAFFRPDVASDRSLIRSIPNGLAMLASADVEGSSSGHRKWSSSNDGLTLSVTFPNCLRVDGDGRPVLTSTDNVSHTRYGHAPTPSNCPASHPYRIPSVSYVVNYAVDAGSGWSLASDHGAPKGSTLHADYIAAWDEASMADLVACVIVERRNCGFAGNRGQLPERFVGPDGRQIYANSVSLLPGADRTPFGTAIKPRAS